MPSKLSMDEVVERLLKSREELHQEVCRKGEDDGRTWAMESASAKELYTLDIGSNHFLEAGIDAEQFFNRLNSLCDGESGDDAESFWRSVTGKEYLDITFITEHYLDHFYHGAIAVWNEVLAR